MRVLLDTCVLSELYKSSPLETVKAEVNNGSFAHQSLELIKL